VRVRVLMCVLASFAVLVAVTAIAAASGGRHHSRVAARLVMPGESSGELRRLRLAAAARMARLHSPAMAGVRRRSRTAFKGASRADALATLRQFFSDVSRTGFDGDRIMWVPMFFSEA
jgi:hypothetical protein